MRSAVAFKQTKNYFSLLSTLVWILNSSLKPPPLSIFLLAHFGLIAIKISIFGFFFKQKKQAKL